MTNASKEVLFLILLEFVVVNFGFLSDIIKGIDSIFQLFGYIGSYLLMIES